VFVEAVFMAKRKTDPQPTANVTPAAPAAKPRRAAKPKAVAARAADDAVTASEPLTAPVAEIVSAPAAAAPAPEARRSGNGAVPAEKIASRAYEIYQSRNGGSGDPLQDWLQAERELTGAHAD
jgi:hypothetical protein